jgi:hypothetical protein
LAGVAVVEVAAADAFQGAGFLEGHAEVLGDRQRLGVLGAGPAWVGQPEGELAEPVERLGLPSRAPRSRNIARACWWLAAAAG